MRHIIEVPDFNPDSGLHATWDDGFEISVRVADQVVTISANASGLRSLARQLLVLAQERTPSGHHFHFDDSNSLEDGSTELVLEKA